MVDIKKLLKINISNEGITMAELLIASALIGLVLLTAAAVDITARRFYSRTEKGVVALNDLTVAMEYMVKYTESAIGEPNTPAFETPSSRGCGCCPGTTDSFAIRSEDPYAGGNEDGRADENFNIEFCYDANNHTIVMFTPDTGIYESISRKATGFTITPDIPVGTEISWVDISLNARDEPSLPASPDNPEVNLKSRVYLRAASAR